MTMPHSYHHCSHVTQSLAVEPAYFDEDAVYEMHMAASSAFKWEQSDKSWARRGCGYCDSDDEEDDERVPPSAASAFQYSYSYHPGSPLEVATPCQVAAAPPRRAYFSDEDDVPAPAEVPVAPTRPATHGEGMLRSTSESALSSVESEYELEDVESATDDTEILDYVLTAASDDTEQEFTMAETKQKWSELLEPLAEPALLSMNMAADPEPHAQTLLAARFMDNTYTHYQFATAATEGSAARAIELGVREMFGVSSPEPTELWTLVQAVFDMTRSYRTAQESAFVQCVLQMLVHLVQRDGKRIEVATVREIAGYVLALADLMRIVVPQAFPSTDGSTDVAVGVGEASPHVLGIMLHFTQYFLFNHPEVMHPIFNTALPVDAILPMQRMLAPMLAQVASDCGAVKDLTNVDVAPTERGTMHPVYGLWERIHSLHVPIELHDTFAPWLQQYCTWVSTFLKETSPKEHFAGRVFETKQEFFRSAAELWFMILRKMPLAYSELSEITSALSEYLPSQHGRKIIDYAKEHFDAQKMSMLPEKMGRMMEFVGVLDRKPDDGDKQGVQHVALKSFVSSRFFTMQMKNLIAQCPNDFYRLSQTKFKHVARAANSERFKDVAQLRANRRHRKRRA